MNRIILTKHEFIRTIQNDEVINSVSTIIRNVGRKCFNPYDLSKTCSSFQIHMANYWLGKVLSTSLFSESINQIFSKSNI